MLWVFSVLGCVYLPAAKLHLRARRVHGRRALYIGAGCSEVVVQAWWRYSLWWRYAFSRYAAVAVVAAVEQRVYKMASGNVEEVQLRRYDTSQPWGFRMQGGSEYNSPLYVAQVCRLLPLLNVRPVRYL